jgi:hypothetical protein
LALGYTPLSGAHGPRPAQAAVDCIEEHRLRVDFIDDDTDDLLTAGGASVQITPDPRDGVGSRTYDDQGSNDENLPVVGRIHEDDACEVSSPDQYSLTVQDLPAGCDVVGDSTRTTTLTSNATVTFHVNNCLDDSDVEIDIDPDRRFLGCGQRTDIDVRVEIEDGTPPDGTDVHFSTNLGSVSPADRDTSGGMASTEYRAPSFSGGTATIRVTVEGISETTTISIGCNVNVAPAQLEFPSATCGGSNANVTFSWDSNNAGHQWLDLTLFDNGFQDGTFINTSAMTPGTERITWNGLIKGLPHYWRVNTLTEAGWVTSGTGTFVPCGGPQIRGVTYVCTGGGRASVTFYWSPPTPSGRANWLDQTLFDPNFGAFLNAGPMENSRSSFTWNGILANLQHFWRFSTLFGNDWVRSNTGSFVAYC